MTIFRGLGGGGNATTDSEINALAAVALEAEASALAASNAATAAAGSASTASTQASNASASASTATTQGGIATTKASEAASSAAAAASAVTGVFSGVPSINGGQVGGLRNVIINGDMRIDQRNNGAAITVNNTGGFNVDRWLSVARGTGSSATVQRVGDAPDGFGYCLSYTNGTGKVAASTDDYYIYQPIEFDNVRHFAYGSSAPKTITFSFYVKSSVVGVYSGFVRSEVAAGNRSYLFEYTVNAANTWELKKIVVPGDSVAISAAGNTTGIGVLFDMGSGSSAVGALGWQSGNFYRTAASVRLSATTGAIFKVTGVQLELGATATIFEQRSYALELALCQLYFISGTNLQAQGYSNTGTSITGFRSFATMRATPTIIYTGTSYVSAGGIGTLAVSPEGFSAAATGTTAGGNSFFFTSWTAAVEL